MQLHYYIFHDCDLKANGPNAFVRAMATYAMARDIELDVHAFAHSRPKTLRSTLLAHATGDARAGAEDTVWLPPLASRSKDPDDGQLELDTFARRVAKIVEKGEICQDCPACANAPTRFGCWGTLTIPPHGTTAQWVLKTWLNGVERAGKSRLVRWFGGEGAPEPRIIIHDRHASTDHGAFEIVWSKGAQSATLNGDRLLEAMAKKPRLEFREISELLADFGAVEWGQLKALYQSLKAKLASDPFRPFVHPDPDLGPVAFLLQPQADDPPGVVEWKSFLFTCYWSLCLAEEIMLQPVEDD